MHYTKKIVNIFKERKKVICITYLPGPKLHAEIKAVSQLGYRKINFFQYLNVLF